MASLDSSPAHPEPEPDCPTQRAWGFIPPLYLAEGIPYVVVNTVAGLMYNKLGIPNDQMALWTSLIAFPWTLKMLWGPLVDLTMTRRRWILGTQAGLAAGMLGVVLALAVPAYFPLTLALFTLVAFLSATHDIAADGFYLLALSPRQQAFFVGVRSTFYRLATIFASGYLVYLAGTLIEGRGAEGATPPWLGLLDGLLTGVLTNPTARAWGVALTVGAGAYALLFLLNLILLPRPPGDRSSPTSPGTPASRRPPPPPATAAPPSSSPHSSPVAWSDAFRTFFSQPKIGWILAFIVFYRFGESMISKLAGPFLQEPLEKGGLGVATSQVGVIQGTYGVAALTVGGILGGVVISRFGIKRCLWPMVLALNLPNLAYLWAALTKPGLAAVTALLVTDQFGYGFGFSAYMVYLMFVCQGARYQTSHYAIATGLMALGALFAGIVSGYVQTHLGYAGLFLTVLVLGVPGIVTLFFIPMDREDIRVAPVDLD